MHHSSGITGIFSTESSQYVCYYMKNVFVKWSILNIAFITHLFIIYGILSLFFTDVGIIRVLKYRMHPIVINNRL